MKKIMGIFILLALITPLFLQHIKAAEFSAVDVNITYQYDSENSSSSVLADKVYGSYVDFQPAVNPSYNFAVWVVNGVVRPDLPENASIKVTSNMNIIGLYAPVGEYGVLFIDTNGQIIDRQYVVSGGTAVPPTNALPNKPGLEIKADAWVSDQGLITFDNVLENRIYTLQYQSSSSDTYDLYIDNVLYSAYPYNELVTVTADASVEGVPFAYWALNGYAVSSDLSYTFTMLEDMNLTKVYENDFENGPMLVMSSDLGIRSGYQSFMAQFYLPDGYELVEWGFLYSNDNTADLTIGAEGVVQAQSNQYNPASNEYLMSFSLGFLDAISAYMFYDDGSSVHVMYSEVTNRFQPSIVGYSTSFENSSKTSYTAAVIDIDGVSWNLDRSLIETTADYVLSGSRALRLDETPGYIASQTYFDAINYISFSARYYGTDGLNQLFVYVSDDSTNWVDVSDAIAGGIIVDAEYQSYLIDLSNSSNFSSSGLTNNNLYVKIENQSGDGQRVDLDDLTIGSEIQYNNVVRVSFIDYDGVSYELYELGSQVIEPDQISRIGYEFNGWFSDYSFQNIYDFNTYLSNDIYLVAQWLALDLYTVDYYSESASFYSENVYDGDLAYGPSSDPSRDGYIFQGWFYDDNTFTNSFDLNVPITSNVTVYAKWVDATQNSPINYTESLDNFNSSTSSYVSGSFIGDNGNTWDYTGSRGDSSADVIDGAGLMFGSSIGNISTSLTEGISYFSLYVKSAFTGGTAADRTINVYVNDQLVGTYTLNAMGVVEFFEINDLNISGDYTLNIVNGGTRQIIIDNISWTTNPGE